MPKESLEINPAGIRLSKKSTVPLYQQLYDQFRNMLLNNRLRPGDRLPASRNLSKELGVSRIIINQAYEQLIMEGYLVGKTGAGTFVADVLPDHLLNAKSTGTKKKTPVDKNTTAIPADETGSRSLIKTFQSGAPALDLFPYKAWQQVGNAVLKDLKSLHLGYEDTLGYWPLRKAIAAYLRLSRAVNCEAEQVVVVTGSQQGLNLIAAVLLKKGDKVWMEDPGYHGARHAFEANNAAICPVPMEADGLNIDAAIQKFGAAKIAYITPSHQFPLGYTLSHEKRLQLLQYAQLNNMVILEDDYDSEFRYKGNPLPSLQGLDTGGNVIYSGTFSKVLFPGLRLAYIVLPTPAMINRFKIIKDNLDRQSPIIEQATLCRFMEQGYFQRHIRKMRLLYAERQQLLLALIKEQLGSYLTVKPVASGMHVVCWLSPTINPDKLQAAAKQHGLIITPVSNYSLQHSVPASITLGFTAFSKYKLKTGVALLSQCIQDALY
jgi:GntR family transcriptional regulator/MocR family aminotransferase